MAKLDSPLYGDEATGTLARAIAFRRTTTWGTAAKIPIQSCPPSPGQITQRSLYAAAIAAWNALTDADHNIYNTQKPANLTGFNFFLRLYLISTLAYFGYCIFGQAWFQLTPSPNQPAEEDYDKNFPISLDKFPTIQNGAHSPQAWLFNSAYNTLQEIQEYLILNKNSIEER